MSFEEEFDKIIRRKAEEEKYPFDESNWEKTSSLLDADRKAARFLNLKKFYLPGTLLLILGSACLITFNYFKNDTNEQVASAIVKADQPNLTSLTDKNSAVQTNNTKEIILQNNPGNNSFASADASLVEGSGSSSENNVHSETVNSNSVKIVPEKTKETISSTRQEQGEIQSESQNTAGTGLQSPVESPVNGVSPESQNGLITENSQNSSVAKENSEGKKSDAKELVLQANEESEEQKLEAERLTAVYSTLPFEMNELELMPTPFNILNRYDDDYYKNNQKPKTNYLNAEFGANYLLGWNAQNGKDGNGLNWFGGLNFGHYLSKKISLSLGIQAYNLGNINQPFYTNTNKEYGFGSINSYTVITSNNLYFLSLPLKFNYAINSSNIVGLGINAGFLLSSQNTVETYYLLDNQKIPVVPTQKNTGIYQGTRTNNMMLSAHYLTHLNKRFGVNAEFNYGLTDIFKNMGEIKNTERSIGFRLSIQYTLFDK